MGKTSQPLEIHVAARWATQPEINALREQGHTVVTMPDLTVDLILHPAAHMWSDEMWPILDIAKKAARGRKYPAKKKGKKK